jgi:membrane protease YdiL (CAAX protease family)
MGPPWAVALYIAGGVVPSGVAVALIALRQGRGGLRSLWQRMTRFRIGWRMYAAALAVVLFGTACQIALNQLLGHAFDFRLFVVQLPSFLPLLVLGPLSEELGWRGYAQDRLQARWSPAVASLIVGVVWALWHLPLFLMPGTSQHELQMPFAGFFFGIASISLVYGWLHNHTGGSVWMAIFFHWIQTYAAQVVATGVTRSALYNWLEYAPYVLAAVVVLVAWGQERKGRAPEALKA